MPQGPLTVEVKLKRIPFRKWLLRLPRRMRAHYKLIGKYYDASWWRKALSAFRLSQTTGTTGTRKLW